MRGIGNGNIREAIREKCIEGMNEVRKEKVARGGIEERRDELVFKKVFELREEVGRWTEEVGRTN